MFKKITKKKLFLLILPSLALLWFLGWLFDLRRIIYFYGYPDEYSSPSRLISSKDEEINERKYETLSQDQEIQGIKFPKGTKIQFKSERIEEVNLPDIVRKIEIQGIKCCDKYGHIKFYKSGKLKYTYLAESQIIQGIDIPEGLGLWLYESGKLKAIKLAVGIFYEDDTFKEMKFTQEEILQIQGIRYLGRGSRRTYFASDGDIEFYESGTVKCGTLSQDQEIQGIKFPKLTEILFYESGKLKSARFPEDQEIQGIKCAKGDVSFYESGKLKSARLAKDQEIQGIKCYNGYNVSFDEKGNITRSIGSLKEDTVIQGINFLKGTHICFYGSGKLDSVNLIQNLKIQGVKFPKRRSGVLFYESGELKAATISGRWRYKDTKTLIFDENGNIGSIYSVDDIMEPGFWRSLINKRER